MYEKRSDSNSLSVNRGRRRRRRRLSDEMSSTNKNDPRGKFHAFTFSAIVPRASSSRKNDSASFFFSLSPFDYITLICIFLGYIKSNFFLSIDLLYFLPQLNWIGGVKCVLCQYQSVVNDRGGGGFVLRNGCEIVTTWRSVSFCYVFLLALGRPAGRRTFDAWKGTLLLLLLLMLLLRITLTLCWNTSESTATFFFMWACRVCSMTSQVARESTTRPTLHIIMIPIETKECPKKKRAEFEMRRLMVSCYTNMQMKKGFWSGREERSGVGHWRGVVVLTRRHVSTLFETAGPAQQSASGQIPPLYVG